jgi:transcriptional regulator with XRE-family HTH domain
MNIGSKLQELRKNKGLSQEELAEILGVSRQSVSKWELDVAYPETEKIIKLAAFYEVTIDSLLIPEKVEKQKCDEDVIVIRKLHYEYKSKKKLFGVPIVHVNIGRGLYVSKGIISIGNISIGFLSFGLLSLGLLSLGVVSFGLISLGAIALALLIALGSISIGTIAIGAVAVGLFSIGAVSIGYFSYGALSLAKYVAIGDQAHGLIAIGETKVSGTYMFMQPYNKLEIYQLIESEVPSIWKIFIKWIKYFIKN